MFEKLRFWGKNRKKTIENKSKYDFSDLDRAHSKEVLHKKSEVKREFERLQCERELLQIQKLREELNEEMSEYYGDDEDDEENPKNPQSFDALAVEFFSRVLDKKMPRDQSQGFDPSQSHNLQNQVPEKTELTDEQILQYLNSIPPQHIEIAKTKTDHELYEKITSEHPNIGEQSIRRAILVLRSK